MRHSPVYTLIAIIAIVVIGLGLATAIVVSSHGYLLDPDGRAHVQALTGLNYGIDTPKPIVRTTAPPITIPTPRPKRVPSPSPTVQVSCTTAPCIIMSVFCNGGSCLIGTQAVRVSMCMSGGNAMNTSATGGMGLFGLRASTWAMSPEAARSPYDATANAKAALWLFQRSGNSWVRWGTCGG